MNIKPRVSVGLYDARRAYMTGKGGKTIYFVWGDPDIETKIKEAREAQHEANRIFRQELKEGKVPPPHAEIARIDVMKHHIMEKSMDTGMTPAELMKVGRLDVAQHNLEEGIEHRGSANSERGRLIREKMLSRRLANPSDAEIAEMRTEFHLKLDPGTGNTILVFGSSKSGKSTALMHIYDRYFAPEGTRPKGEDYISTLWTNSPNIPLYQGHNGLIIGNKFDKTAESLIKMEKKINASTENRYKFLNIYDDIIEVRHVKLINAGMLYYRNSNMSQIVSLQYSNLLSKMSRGNAHNILAFNMLSTEATELIVKTYFSSVFRDMGIKGLADQVSFYKAMTKDHGFLYLRPKDNKVTFHKIKL
jgi:hypothetical protein